MPVRPATPRILLRTALVAVGGGFIAHLLHIPLAWMIGAMLATATMAWRGPGRAAVPIAARPAALVVLGLGLGQSFSGPVLAAVGAALPAILAGGLLSFPAGLAVMRVFLSLGRTDRRTAFFCAVPGGVIIMAVLAQRAGASVPAVTLSQTLRMVVVVLTFPPLLALLGAGHAGGAFAVERLPLWWPGLLLLLAAGIAVAFAGRRLGLANPWMFGPCALAILLSAFGRMPSGVPIELVDAAQIAMGATLGARLTRDFVLGSRRLAVASLVSALLLSALLALCALPLALLSGLPVAAVVLGLAPGGMPEMAVTAKALDLAVPLVLGFHLTRTVLCNLVVGPLWRLIEMRSAGRPRRP